MFGKRCKESRKNILPCTTYMGTSRKVRLGQNRLDNILLKDILLQGVRMQTVTSNLAMTDRKNTTNFNLIANYIQGRLGIYAWMINEIPSWPLLASVTSNFTIHIFYLTVWSTRPTIAKPQTGFTRWFYDFFNRFQYCTTSPTNIAPFWLFFASFMALSRLLVKTWRN